MVAHTLLDPPTAVLHDVVLDIPIAPSVNITRRHDPAGWGKLEQWKVAAGQMLLANGQYRTARKHLLPGAFEVWITIDPKCRMDLDNHAKNLIDFLRRLKLIRDDSPDLMVGVHIVKGYAPAGARIVLRGAP